MSALLTYKTPILAEWVDYNGHLRDAFYLLIFSHATDALMDQLGLDSAHPEADGHSLFTLECHVNFLHEVKLGVQVEVRTQVLSHDRKRLHIYHSLHLPAAKETLAASEQMLLHVELAGPRSAPFTAAVLSKVQALGEAHLRLPTPAWAGRVIGLPG